MNRWQKVLSCRALTGGHPGGGRFDWARSRHEARFCPTSKNSPASSPPVIACFIARSLRLGGRVARTVSAPIAPPRCWGCWATIQIALAIPSLPDDALRVRRRVCRLCRFLPPQLVDPAWIRDETNPVKVTNAGLRTTLALDRPSSNFLLRKASKRPSSFVGDRRRTPRPDLPISLGRVNARPGCPPPPPLPQGQSPTHPRSRIRLCMRVVLAASIDACFLSGSQAPRRSQVVLVCPLRRTDTLCVRSSVACYRPRPQTAVPSCRWPTACTAVCAPALPLSWQRQDISLHRETAPLSLRLPLPLPFLSRPGTPIIGT